VTLALRISLLLALALLFALLLVPVTMKQLFRQQAFGP